MMVAFPVTERIDRTAWLAMAVVAVGVGLRLLAVPGQVGDVDSVNHAAALAGFDPFAQAPHFPGYPVFTVATQAFAGLGLSDVWALSLPGILLCVPACMALFVTLHGLLGAPGAMFVLGVCALAPGVVVVGAWPASDGFGFAMLLLSAAWLLRSGRGNGMVGGVIAGLTLGARLSYGPALLPLLMWPVLARGGWDGGQARRVAAGCLGGILLWLVPMLCLLDIAALGQLAVGFVSGHFSDFGGTATATGAGPRVGQWLGQVWGQGLGAVGAEFIRGDGFEHSAMFSLKASGGVVVTLGMLVSMALLVRGSVASAEVRRALWGVVALGLPYALWLALGQNPDKPRHVLPLLPLIGVGMGLVLRAGRLQRMGAAAVLLAMVAVSLPRAQQQHGIPVPAVALVQHLQSLQNGEQVLVLAGPESRLLSSALPALRVLRPLNMTVALGEAARVVELGVRPLLTTSIPGFNQRQSLSLVAAAEFPRDVRPQDGYLGLYEFQKIEPIQAQLSSADRAAHRGLR